MSVDIVSKVTLNFGLGLCIMLFVLLPFGNGAGTTSSIPEIMIWVELVIFIILCLNGLRMYLNHRENKRIRKRRDSMSKLEQLKEEMEKIDFENGRIEDIFREVAHLWRKYPHKETRDLLWKHFRKCCDRDRIIMDEL